MTSNDALMLLQAISIYHKRFDKFDYSAIQFGVDVVDCYVLCLVSEQTYFGSAAISSVEFIDRHTELKSKQLVFSPGIITTIADALIISQLRDEFKQYFTLGNKRIEARPKRGFNGNIHDAGLIDWLIK